MPVNENGFTDIQEFYESNSYNVLPNEAVPPPSGRLLVKRNGKSITRQIPKPFAIVDSREKEPFSFSKYKNWFAGESVGALKAGDYSIAGMEDLIALERKSLPDLVNTLIHERTRFFKLCDKLSQLRWKAILVEASYEDVKSPYNEFTNAHPNAVSGTLDALEAKFGIPVIYTSQYKHLAEEKSASWLSKHFTYWYLETNGLGRILQEGDI